MCVFSCVCVFSYYLYDLDLCRVDEFLSVNQPPLGEEKPKGTDNNEKREETSRTSHLGVEGRGGK